MKTRLLARALVPTVLGGIALASAGATMIEPPEIVVQEIMQHGINVATMEIWDVGNNAMGNDGGMDPAQMTPEKWTRLETAALGLKNTAIEMEGSGQIVAASPENTPQEGEPGAVSMADVQRYIDADPEGFRAAARQLADHAGLLVGAAQARDAKAAGDLVAQLDQVCEVCHAKYWYPEQDALALR